MVSFKNLKTLAFSTHNVIFLPRVSPTCYACRHNKLSLFWMTMYTSVFIDDHHLHKFAETFFRFHLLAVFFQISTGLATTLTVRWVSFCDPSEHTTNVIASNNLLLFTCDDKHCTAHTRSDKKIKQTKIKLTNNANEDTLYENWKLIFIWLQQEIIRLQKWLMM